jgi:hypothetical protein
MKLFQDLNRYVTQNATVSLAGNNPVNVAECSNTIFQGLLALHVLRQEPESHHVIREYAENTLQIANSTGLYEFLHVMHTEVLREHARDEKSYFTKSEIDQQIRVTHEFLHACSEVTYPQSMQNQRLLQLESSYKITSTADKKLRRDVANWQKLDADTRWSVCQKLWENIHRTQGLRDLRNCLRRYVQEQKWPAPVTGEKPPVSAANRMQLLTRLPVVKENLEASQGVKDLEHALTKTQDHSYENIDKIMRGICQKLSISPHQLHKEFVSQHQMTPDDWVRQSNVRGFREETNIPEAIKGWKHAQSDLAKWRAGKKSASQPVKLVSVKKDGNESKMHDAVKTFDTQDQALEYHKRLIGLNPGRNIKHNLYVDGQLVQLLDATHLKEVRHQIGAAAEKALKKASDNGNSQARAIEKWKQLDAREKEIQARSDANTGKYAKTLDNITRQKTQVAKNGNLNAFGKPVSESASAGGTSAGAIASMANPQGQVNRRPSLFGYVPEDAPAPKRKNIFQVGDQVISRWGDRKDQKPHTITKIDGDFIHTDEQSFFNPENSLFHHENFVLYKRRQDV